VEPSLALPADGVYATWAQTQGGRYPCATSIGVRPTFGPGPRTVEGHLLDFSGDLYGQTVRLEFAHRLRDEERFEGPEALVAQLHLDVDRVRALLTPAGPAPSEATTQGGTG
jgi:riboflavin kinase/FMN adenylyltransferase